jgi:hypothetical protein
MLSNSLALVITKSAQINSMTSAGGICRCWKSSKATSPPGQGKFLSAEYFHCNMTKNFEVNFLPKKRSSLQKFFPSYKIIEKKMFKCQTTKPRQSISQDPARKM